MKTRLMVLACWGALCISACTNTPKQQSSNNESKTTIQLLKEDGWTEYCTVRAYNPRARDVSGYESSFVILYKDDKYAAILGSDKYDKHSVGYSPNLFSASRGSFRVPRDDGYSTYTGRVVCCGTHFYFDF